LSSGWARQGIVNQPLLCDDTNIQRKAKQKEKRKMKRGKRKGLLGTKMLCCFVIKRAKGREPQQ